MWLVLLVACGRVHRPSCENTTRTIADDEPLPDVEYTVNDLFAGIAGERVVPTQILDVDQHAREVTAVSVAVARGEGDATWTDSEEVDEVSVTLLYGDDFLDLFVRCDGGLSVPAVLDAAREDGTASLTAEGKLTATPDGLADETVQASGTVTDGDWGAARSAFASYEEGQLTGLQIGGDNHTLADWR